jgi:Tol biopolymer transport system component
MTPERWEQIGRLHEAVAQLPPAERAAYLAGCCEGDEALRREVESLLAAEEAAGEFLAPGAMKDAARMLVGEEGLLPVGGRVGHYRVLSLLGEGGMGEVYLARDTRLGRNVALKLLPASFSRDAERVRRFEQEARATARLAHPNVCTIFETGEAEDGRRYITMEHIEGVTLRQLLTGRRIELSEALDMGVQITSALAAAHEAGVIHRDIKPENVIVRRDKLVKVLDFGLAKLTREHEAADSASPTRPPVRTESGMVMGTVSYMSPEQAQGQAVDARTDIWSVGCVLYEMVCGHVPFEGSTSSHVIVSILEKEPPPLTQYRPDVPPELERIVSKALRKDREQRYQTIKDLAVDLNNLRRDLEISAELERLAPPDVRGGAVAAPGGPQPPADGVQAPAPRADEGGAAHPMTGAESQQREVKRYRRGVASAVGIVLIALAGVAFAIHRWLDLNSSLPPAAPLRIVPFTTLNGNESGPTFSPDGTQIAFVWDGEAGENEDVYVKVIGAGVPLRLTTNPAADMSPAWSPDGRSIAFIRWSAAGSGIYVIPPLGGRERILAELDTRGSFAGGWTLSWTLDGSFLAAATKGAPEEPYSIFLFSVETGERRKLTSPPPGSQGDFRPAVSPDGKTLAFERRAGRSGAADLYRVSVEGGEPERLTFDNAYITSLAWTANGREIMFGTLPGRSVGSLWRIPAEGGAPERLPIFGQNVIVPAVSRQGDRLAYEQSLADVNIWRIAVPGSTRRSTPPMKLISSTLQDMDPQYSPDGTRIVFVSTRSGNLEIWACESDGANPVQLTDMEMVHGGTPRWSPDGRLIAFDSDVEGNSDIYVVSGEGGRVWRLTADPAGDVAPSWSRDGRWIYFGSDRSGSLQIWKMPADGGDARQVTRQGGFEGFESPEGAFFYYAKGQNVPGIWRVPVEGGEETLVLDHHGAGYWRYWAVVAEGIYFATAEEASRPVIEFFNFATGKVTQVAALEKRIVEGEAGMDVSPDQRWILYMQEDQSGSDIMLVENFRTPTE